MIVKLFAWLDKHMRDDDRITRAKKFVVLFVCLFAGVGLFGNYLIFLARHDDVIPLDHFFLLVVPFGVILTSPKFCVESRNIERTANYIFGASYLAIVANTIHAGSTITFVAYVLLALSICYALMFGWRGFVIAAIVSALHIGIFVAIEKYIRFDFTLFYRSGEVTTPDDIIATLKNYTIVFLTASSCAATFHHEMSRAVTELADARGAADAANAAKSQFLANMSHEIRTPMSGVIGMLEVLRREDPSPVSQARIDTALRSAKDLLFVLNDIVDVAQLEGGKLALDREAFSPTGLVEDVVGLFDSLAREQSLTLRTEIMAPMPEWLLGDPHRVRQVLTNLIGNAVKFTEAGGVTVALRYESEPGLAHFSVRDTGVGVDPAMTNRIFDRFFQADISPNRRHSGSGLGLAICKQLIVMMGGTIGVDSRPGEGATFHFTIPAPIAPPPAPAPDILQAEPARPLRILVAEDNPAMQQILRTLLESAGHDVTVVPDGATAVASVAGDIFDVILMDAMMPVMDGPTAAQRIRKLDARSATLPIIVLTANALAGDRDRYLAAGMTEYLSKPIDVAALFTVLGRVAATT